MNFGGADKYLAEYVAAMTRAGLGSVPASRQPQAQVRNTDDVAHHELQPPQQQQEGAAGGVNSPAAVDNGPDTDRKVDQQDRSSDGTALQDEAQTEDSSGSTPAAGATTRDLYVASGMLAYAPEEEKAALFEFLQPYATRILHKEMFLSKVGGSVMGGE